MIRLFCFVVSVFFINISMAYTTLKIQDVVPQDQINRVAEIIRKDMGPSSSKVSKVLVNGTLTFDDFGRLVEFNMDPLQFNASFLLLSTTTKIKSNVSIAFGNCDELYLNSLDVTGTNVLMDGPIRSAVKKDWYKIMQYVLTNTNISNYCQPYYNF